jgi:glycosyltransferase involved in cell wall biosynthesis
VLQGRIQTLSLLRPTLKILYISQYFPPEMGAPSARVSELARHWVAAGHEVTVLTGFPNHPDGVVRPDYRERFWRGFCREDFHGVKVLRTFLLPFPNRKPYERILNYTSFCISAAMAGSFVGCPDVVIATSPQLLVGLSGWWASRVKKVPFVLEVRDLWPESLVGTGVGQETSLMYRSIGKVASFLYRRADSIVVVTPSFRDHLVRAWNVEPEKIDVVQNGVETALFSPQESASEIRAQLGLASKFVVSYIGTLGLAHGLETLVAAAERLQTVAPQVLFMLVGEGADRERILSLAQSKQLTNLVFVPQQPREKIPAYISASDACVVMLKDKEVFETVIPTKMLEFMSCARPVILAVRGQAKRVLEAAGGGICIEPDNPQALCSAILQLQQSPALCAEMGKYGRNYIVRELSREKTAMQYLSTLKALVEGAPKQAAVAA